MKPYYTLKDIMEITRLSERTIRRYLKQGKLNGDKIGKEWRFQEEDVKQLFDNIDFSSQISSLANKR
ncbi:MAG: helix-turn-helix domain-containing protein [Candidatus Izemoplasma sp.]|nr:helix-turn-helix domain-containing protein [Candidatus Izemoplasma sp.]